MASMRKAIGVDLGGSHVMAAVVTEEGEILDRHGIRGTEPAAVLRHPALPAACRDVAAIAENHFRQAARAMEQCSRRAMRPAAVMAALYRAMLSALQRSGWRVPTERVGVSTSLKIWLVLRHGLL